MTKREEIREVIDAHVDDRCHFPDRSCNALGSGYCSSDDEAYKCLMERLTEIGVVIKVEGELPMVRVRAFPTYSGKEMVDECDATQRDMLKAGYVKTEELI